MFIFLKSRWLQGISLLNVLFKLDMPFCVTGTRTYNEQFGGNTASVFEKGLPLQASCFGVLNNFWYHTFATCVFRGFRWWHYINIIRVYVDRQCFPSCLFRVKMHTFNIFFCFQVEVAACNSKCLLFIFLKYFMLKSRIFT